jgi:peroxidase
MKRSVKLLLFALAGASAGCSGGSSGTSPVPVSSAVITPVTPNSSGAATPNSSLTSTQKSWPTATPSPSATAMPVHTPTPMPVHTPTPTPMPTGVGSATPGPTRGVVSLLREFRPIGGGGNNLTNPALNPVPGSPELNIAPLRLGINNALVAGPNPRTISNVISGGAGSNGQNGQTDDPTRSAWVYVMGQFVDHDLSLEETPQTSTPINIIIPANDPVFAQGTAIQLTRATRSPVTNTIINTSAGFLDLSQLYGSDPTTAATLAYPDGSLKTSDNGQALPVENGSFVSGDPRVTENPELTVATTLFMREHNYWVRTLKIQHPTWTPSQLYSMAKAINTAEYQNILYTEFLPQLIGNVLGPYTGYDPTVNPQVTQEFSTAAFRLHTLVSDTEEGVDAKGNTVFSESLAQAFFNTPAQDEQNGLDALLRHIGVDFSQNCDPFTVAVLRDLLVAGLVGGDVDKIDLMAIDIKRESDVGLGTLNQTRKALGMQPYTSFSQLTADPVVQGLYSQVYGSIDKVDLFMGGLAEAHVAGADVGPTFEAIIADQFRRLRSGDRFWWQNEPFDSQTASMIGNTTLATLIDRDSTVTNLTGNLFIEANVPGVTTPAIKHHVVVNLP